MSNIHRNSYLKLVSMKARSSTELVGDYIQTLKPSSRPTYENMWALFSAWLDAQKLSILNLSELNARQFMQTLEQRKGFSARSGNTEVLLSKRTLAKHSTILKRFVHVISSEHGVRTINPFEAIARYYNKCQVKQRRPTEQIPFDSVMRLLDSPEKDNKRGIRDRAILSLLVGGGLRRAEITNINIGHIRRNSGLYYVTLMDTKNGNDAEQPIAEFASEAISILLAQRIEEGATSKDAFFTDYREDRVSATHRRLSPATIYGRFKHYCKKNGLSHTLSPHSARATAITKLLEEGVPHREVKEFSRHSSIENVLIYDKKRDELPTRVAKKLLF